MTGHPSGTLRRAAKLMRERAEAATPGPWECAGGGDITHGLQVVEGGIRRADWVASVDTGDGDLAAAGTDESNALHIASWHPLVAPAVADWLDEAAGEAEAAVSSRLLCRRCGGWLADERENSCCHCWDKAIAAAHAYLGEVPA